MPQNQNKSQSKEENDSHNENQISVDVVTSEDLSAMEVKFQEENNELKNQLNNLKESHSDVKKSLKDLKTFVVSHQNQSEQLLETKIEDENEHLKNEVKSLKESLTALKNFVTKKSFDDLKKLVMSENQNKSQNKKRIGSNNNSATSGNEEEINVENQSKKVKLEDPSEEVETLNQIIKDLREDNLKLRKEIENLKNGYGSKNGSF